jgi:lathosterol oxidase
MLPPMTTLGFVVLAVAVGLGMYLGVGGWFEWRYYRRRRDQADAWKCQPRRLAPPRVRRRDLLLGGGNLVAGSIVSGVLAAAIANDNPTAIYFGGHGLVFSLATALAYFLATDAALYAAHRLYHRPAAFRLIHRWHHRNTTPTAFTATAMHPVEFATYQTITMAPLFVLPVHVVAVIVVLLYQNFVALVDHSGVRLRPLLPFQPPPRFHDDHHLYFHVNFGQTLGLWDRVCGTWRREGRRYGENVFGGRGAPDGDEAGPPRYVRYDEATP